MSAIDPRLNPSLPAGLDALDRQGVDGLQGRPAQLDVDPALAELATEALREPVVDGGETVLNAAAWTDPESGHPLEDQAPLVAQLGGDRDRDADTGVDAVLSGLGLD